jgi:hypothetical protein
MIGNKKTITNAKYIADFDGNNNTVSCTINDVGVTVPLDPANSDYAEIEKQRLAGTLTIADAD